jgi:tetratricopeptide (TPR) repeat protein
MASLKSLTVVAVVSGASADKTPSQEAEEMMASRGGVFITQRGRAALWSFQSPTEAILAAIGVGQNSAGASICAGVAIGEMTGTGDSISGEPVEEAISLSLKAKPMQVLLTKGTQLSMNHNEIDCGDTLFVERKNGGGKIEAYEAFAPGKGNGSKETQPSSNALSPDNASFNKVPSGKNSLGLNQRETGHFGNGGFKHGPLLPVFILLLVLLAFGGGFYAGSSKNYLKKAKAMEKLGASSYALELALSAWEEDRGNPFIEDFLTNIAINESKRFIASDRPDLATKILMRVKEVDPVNMRLDDTYFNATASVIRSLVLKNRDDVATELGSKLLLDIPNKSDAIASVIAMAKVDRTEKEIEQYIQNAPDNPDFTLFNQWRTVLNAINVTYPELGKVWFLFGRINLVSNNIGYMSRNFARAIELDPSLSKERAILADILRACKEPACRESDLVRSVQIMSASLDDWVVKEIKPWLTDRNSVVRTTAYKVLKARNALPESGDGLFRFHLLNLKYESSTEERRTQIPLAILMDSLHFAESVKEGDKIAEVISALSAMPEEPLKIEEVSALRDSILKRLAPENRIVDSPENVESSQSPK